MPSPVSLPGTRASIRRRAGRRVATTRIYDDNGVLLAAAGQPIPDHLEVDEDQVALRDDVPAGTTTRESGSTDADALAEALAELAEARERIAELDAENRDLHEQLNELDPSTTSPDHDDTESTVQSGDLDDLTVNQLLELYEEYKMTPPKNAKRADLIAGLQVGGDDEGDA